MRSTVVFRDPSPDYIEQYFRVMDYPGMLHHLAGVEPGHGEGSGDGDDVHAGSYPCPDAVRRVFQLAIPLRSAIMGHWTSGGGRAGPAGCEDSCRYTYRPGGHPRRR